MTKVIRHTRFEPNPYGNGGEKRSAQIQELLERSGAAFFNEDFLLPKNFSVTKKIGLFVRGLSFVIQHFSWKEMGGVGNTTEMSKYFGLRIPIILNHYSQQDVLFLNENTTSGAYGLPYLMKAAGKPLISVPHNLESFCSEDVQSGKKVSQWLYEDVKRLKMSDRVFCISKEETWLLRLLGVNADYLPYYPTAEVEEYLKGIREKRIKRESNAVNKCLILGSAFNLPTGKGMEQVIRWFAKYERLPFELHIAGYGTNSFLNVTHPDFSYHGTVSKEQLEELLIEVDCLIINQPPSSGALTRIVESLIAGLPVFSNMNAARDYYGTEGVAIFQTFDDLFELLKRMDLPRCVSLPIRNATAELAFLESIAHFGK